MIGHQSQQPANTVCGIIEAFKIVSLQTGCIVRSFADHVIEKQLTVCFLNDALVQMCRNCVDTHRPNPSRPCTLVVVHNSSCNLRIQPVGARRDPSGLELILNMHCKDRKHFAHESRRAGSAGFVNGVMLPTQTLAFLPVLLANAPSVCSLCMTAPARSSCPRPILLGTISLNPWDMESTCRRRACKPSICQIIFNACPNTCAGAQGRFEPDGTRRHPSGQD